VWQERCRSRSSAAMLKVPSNAESSARSDLGLGSTPIQHKQLPHRGWKTTPSDVQLAHAKRVCSTRHGDARDLPPATYRATAPSSLLRLAWGTVAALPEKWPPRLTPLLHRGLPVPPMRGGAAIHPLLHRRPTGRTTSPPKWARVCLFTRQN
jgi:hypothetical protein